MRLLWVVCGNDRARVRNGHTPMLDEGWSRWRPEQSERLAAHVFAEVRT